MTGPVVTGPAMGSGALLRIAALPLRSYAQAGSPELFDQLFRLDAQATSYAASARAAAADLGKVLIPRPGLSAGERGTVLALRRALHRGDLVHGDQARQVAALAAGQGTDAELAARLSGLAQWADELRSAADSATEAVAAELDRLLGLPWRLLHEYPAGRLALTEGDLPAAADVEARLAEGEPWTTKRMRQRDDYLWRMIARGSTRSTPRGWLAHSVALTVASSGWTAGTQVLIEDLVAVEVTQNIDHILAEADRLTTGQPRDDLTVSRAPLAWIENDYLLAWQLRGEERTSLTLTRLRRTGLLDAIWGRLAGGPEPMTDLVRELVGPDEAKAVAVARFLAQLTSVGACQIARPPTAGRSGLTSLSRRRPGAGLAAADGYRDVYRSACAPLARAHGADLAGAVTLALRVMACAERGAEPMPAKLPASLTEEPRPLLEVAADCVHGEEDIGAHVHRHDWQVPVTGDTGYQRMHAWLTAQLPGAADGGGQAIDIDAAMLDAWDVPQACPSWPTDVLVRPLAGGAAGPIAVLSALSPAGVLDARFMPALGGIGEPLPQAVAYQLFLDRLSGLAGVPFVEVLIPPLSARAANAVRRPCYTRYWTGDPDPSCYFDAVRPSEYLPLAAITVRREGQAVVAEHDGRRIWPVIHTARVASGPWLIVRSLLSLASPQSDRQSWRSLSYSLPAWPDHGQIPRITVGGKLVLTASQWRVRRGDLGSPQDRLVDRARALATLRRTRSLPRWVTIRAESHDEPVVADLDSLRTLRTVDRVPAKHETLTFAELIPGPDELPVRDLAEPASQGHWAELLLRLPFAASPEIEAAAVASGYLSSRQSPG